jgi:hypothetical protein
MKTACHLGWRPLGKDETMPELCEGMYKIRLSDLRAAVNLVSTQVFVDKKDQHRLATRILGQVEPKLAPLPAQNPEQYNNDFIEVPVLDQSYRATIASFLNVAQNTRGYHMAKIESRLFAGAWTKAHTELDCRDLAWTGWSLVLNRLIDLMDKGGDGNPTFIMLRAFDQWRDTLEKAGIAEMMPSIAPFHHFHIEVKVGELKAVFEALEGEGLLYEVAHLNALGANHDRDRYLLTLLTPVKERRLHALLKLPAVSKVTASKLDYTA